MALPEEPNILEALAIIWNIEVQAIVIDGIAKDAPALRVTEDPELKWDPIESRMHAKTPPSGNGKRKTG